MTETLNIPFWGKENRTFSMRSFSFPQTPNLSWQRPKGIPLWKPQSYVFLLFLFLLLVVISFGYLAIYTNEHLLLLNNVDRIEKNVR